MAYRRSNGRSTRSKRSTYKVGKYKTRSSSRKTTRRSPAARRAPVQTIKIVVEQATSSYGDTPPSVASPRRKF